MSKFRAGIRREWEDEVQDDEDEDETKRPPYNNGASVRLRLTQSLPATAQRMMNPIINATAPAVLRASRTWSSIFDSPSRRQVWWMNSRANDDDFLDHD